MFSLERFGCNSGCDLKELTRAAEEAKSVRTLYHDFEAPYGGVTVRC